MRTPLDALAEIDTVFETLLPGVGDPIDTVGEEMVPFETVTETAFEMPLLPAVSNTTAVSVWTALLEVFVFQDIE